MLATTGLIGHPTMAPMSVWKKMLGVSDGRSQGKRLCECYLCVRERGREGEAKTETERQRGGERERDRQRERIRGMRSGWAMICPGELQDICHGAM